jgi:hypothetical protein
MFRRARTIHQDGFSSKSREFQEALAPAFLKSNGLGVGGPAWAGKRPLKSCGRACGAEHPPLGKRASKLKIKAAKKLRLQQREDFWDLEIAGFV